MQGTGIWVLGGLVGIIGIVGLLLAAHAEEGPIYIVGLIVFGLAIAVDGWLIKRGYDRAAGAGSAQT